MLVDDHIVIRQGIARLLSEEQDFEVVGEASDGASAIRLAKEIRPDVILMDISMPGMSGIETTKIIQSENPNIRIIGLSMFEESEKSAQMREAGAAGYLIKSGPADDLIKFIRRSIEPHTLPEWS